MASPVKREWVVYGRGKQKTLAMGVDPFEAAVAAVKTNALSNGLGAVIMAHPADEKPNDDNTFFMSTERVVTAAEAWKK